MVGLFVIGVLLIFAGLVSILVCWAEEEWGMVIGCAVAVVLGVALCLAVHPHLPDPADSVECRRVRLFTRTLADSVLSVRQWPECFPLPDEPEKGA